MTKLSAVAISILLLVGAVPAYAWQMDYQDPNGSHDLSIGSDWFRITDGGNPLSKDGNVGPPLSTDKTYIRTGSADLFINSGTVTGSGVDIGGIAITDPNLRPTTTTVVTVGSGGQIVSKAADSTTSTDNLYIGYNYNGKLVVDGGTVQALSPDGLSGSMLSLGGKGATTTGTLEVHDGLVQFGRMYAAWQNGTAIINQDGGTVEAIANAGGVNTFYFGYVNAGLAGSATWNLEDGNAWMKATPAGAGYYITWRAGKALFNQTGGSAYWKGTAHVGRNDATGSATGWSDGEYRLLGGRTTVEGSLQMGSGGQANKSKGKFKVNQAGTLDCTGAFVSNSTSDVIELVVSSASDFSMTVGGNLTWSDPNGALRTFAVTLSGYAPTVGQTWKVADVGGTISLPADGYHPDGARYNFYDPVSLLAYCLYKDIPNSDLRLEYVPEPATLVLLGLGGLALLRRRRS